MNNLLSGLHRGRGILIVINKLYSVKLLDLKFDLPNVDIDQLIIITIVKIENRILSRRISISYLV